MNGREEIWGMRMQSWDELVWETLNTNTTDYWIIIIPLGNQKYSENFTRGGGGATGDRGIEGDRGTTEK